MGSSDPENRRGEAMIGEEVRNFREKFRKISGGGDIFLSSRKQEYS